MALKDGIYSIFNDNVGANMVKGCLVPGSPHEPTLWRLNTVDEDEGLYSITEVRDDDRLPLQWMYEPTPGTQITLADQMTAQGRGVVSFRIVEDDAGSSKFNIFTAARIGAQDAVTPAEDTRGNFVDENRLVDTGVSVDDLGGKDSRERSDKRNFLTKYTILVLTEEVGDFTEGDSGYSKHTIKGYAKFRLLDPVILLG
ncbi:hypothetical protein BGZ94_005269 [Podila epigama]|nr:hypothetical protein BGZ94_005269 [Podila epigama]